MRDGTAGADTPSFERGAASFHASPPRAVPDAKGREMRSETNCTNRGGRLKPTRCGRPSSKTCKGAKMLSNIIGLVSGCVTFLGGFLIVRGAVSLGLAIREQQGGAQIASAISTIAGGAIIIAAAIYFGQLDTSWLPA